VYKKLIQTGKRALIVEPFVSAVAEKVAWFKRLFRPFKRLKVGGYYSNARTRFPIERADVAICTIEKANAAINKMVEDQSLKDIGIIVVDELHLIGDENRGYLLELLLTKIRYLRGGDIQVIGMSATLPNLDLIARWLKAHLYITTTRPVPLQEYVSLCHWFLFIKPL
jgi:DNA polymerase theta